MIGVKRPRSKKSQAPSTSSSVLSEKEMVKYFKQFSGKNVSKDAIPTLVESSNNFMEEAMDRLRLETHGATPKLGDYKDLFEYYGLIPKENGMRHLNAFLEQTLDHEDLYRLIPMPLMDGSGGTTIPKDIWNQRAADDVENLPLAH